MSEIKNGGLDQYGAEPFKQQQFATAGAEGVNSRSVQDILGDCYEACDGLSYVVLIADVTLRED